MDIKYRLYEETKKILYREHETISQTIRTDNGSFLLNCSLICKSYSHFEDEYKYHHPSPPFSRLFVVEDGCADITMDSAVYHLRRGDIAFLPAERAFYADYHTGFNCKGFHLYLHDSLGFTLDSELLGVQILGNKELFACLLKAIHRQPENHGLLPLLFHTVLHFAEPAFKSAQSRHMLPPFYKKLLAEMAGIPPARLRLDEIAAAHGLTRSSLGKNFRKYLGMPFKQYQKQLLMQKAKKLLMDNTFTVSQTANELGFSNIFYFFDFFRRETGMTPAEYRQKNSGV